MPLVDGGEPVRFGFASDKLVTQFVVFDPNNATTSRAKVRGHIFEVQRAQALASLKHAAIVGSTFLDVLDAFYDDKTVEYINVRHEQAAAFMADGLARVTDVPGVWMRTFACHRLGLPNLAYHSPSHAEGERLFHLFSGMLGIPALRR